MSIGDPSIWGPRTLEQELHNRLHDESLKYIENVISAGKLNNEELDGLNRKTIWARIWSSGKGLKGDSAASEIVDAEVLYLGLEEVCQKAKVDELFCTPVEIKHLYTDSDFHSKAAFLTNLQDGYGQEMQRTPH